MIDYMNFRAICEKADYAGKEAVEKARIVPMIVGQEIGFFTGKLDYSKPIEYVEDGVCGFAWVSVTPQNKGNTKLGKEERKVLEATGFRKNDYTRTYQKSISGYNQSMQKKEAYANAFADVLRANGVKAYASSRMD
jgi:hypothetical protein